MGLLNRLGIWEYPPTNLGISALSREKGKSSNDNVNYKIICFFFCGLAGFKTYNPVIPVSKVNWEVAEELNCDYAVIST